MTLGPVTLEGQHVRLEPLTMQHHAALWAIAQDAELWRWTAADVRTPEDLRIHGYAVEQAAGRAPFVTIARAVGQIVGSTLRQHRRSPPARRDRLDLAHGRDWQRTALNTGQAAHAHPRVRGVRLHAGRAAHQTH
jgi:hypothetical protein